VSNIIQIKKLEKCEHTFCKKCINILMKTNKFCKTINCPLCRSKNNNEIYNNRLTDYSSLEYEEMIRSITTPRSVHMLILSPTNNDNVNNDNVNNNNDFIM
jgi:hypothetical protein